MRTREVNGIDIYNGDIYVNKHKDEFAPMNVDTVDGARHDSAESVAQVVAPRHGTGKYTLLGRRSNGTFMILWRGNMVRDGEGNVKVRTHEGVA